MVAFFLIQPGHRQRTAPSRVQGPCVPLGFPSVSCRCLCFCFVFLWIPESMFLLAVSLDSAVTVVSVVALPLLLLTRKPSPGPPKPSLKPSPGLAPLPLNTLLLNAELRCLKFFELLVIYVLDLFHVTGSKQGRSDHMGPRSRGETRWYPMKTAQTYQAYKVLGRLRLQTWNKKSNAFVVFWP